MSTISSSATVAVPSDSSAYHHPDQHLRALRLKPPSTAPTSNNNSGSSSSNIIAATITTSSQHSRPQRQPPNPQTQPHPLRTPSSTNNFPAPQPTITTAAAAAAAAAALCRQTRPTNSPLYVPAALRPTEKPVRHQTGANVSAHDAGGTSPQSREGSRGSDGVGVGHHVRTRTGPPTAQSDCAMFGPGISRIVTEEWNDAALGKVTGPPTRDHWKPDSSAPTCAAPSCTRPFAFLSHRRHHCRRCGNVFCAAHSSHAVPLDQHARFHPDGYRHRACDLCWADFRAWRAARPASSSRSTTASSASAASDDGPGTPPLGVGALAAGRRPDQAATAAKAESFAASVPRDWNWSTF